MTNTVESHAIVRVQTGGADLHVETRGSGPAVLLFGCPMDAEAFAPLAEQLATDHTVITVDPRGFKRSTVANQDEDVTPEDLAGDLSAVLHELEIDSAVIFGSSGGAVAALAFAEQHPEQVELIVAHEPPLETLLEDHEQLRLSTEEMVRCYLDGDITGAWTRFFASANIDMPDGAVAGWLDGRTDPQELADERFFFAHTLRPATYWRPDVAALSDHGVRIVIGVGSESAGQVCDRTTAALASELNIPRTTFIGDHTGFVDHPDQFAEQLRTVLTEGSRAAQTDL